MELPAILLASREWPDGFDSALIVAFVLLVLTGPLLGYWLMVIDIRAYLRALRGVLVVVKETIPRMTPYWAHMHTPNCIRALGLELPCSEDDVKQAYRQMAKSLHPDRGGDRQRFMSLQTSFEEAISFIQSRASTAATSGRLRSLRSNKCPTLL